MINKKNVENITRINRLSHEGRGIAIVGEKKTFIDGALANELVTYRLQKKRSSYNEAELVNILEAAPNRVVPDCDHFSICGGCSLQHMDMATQLQLKQETLLNHLEHFGKLKPQNLLNPLTAASLGYRRKARLGVRYVNKKEKLLVGFREKNSRYLAELKQCLVLHPRVGLRFNEISELITSLNCYRDIPQIEVAIGDHDIALVFRNLADIGVDDRQRLIKFGQDYQFQIYLQPNKPAKLQKVWPHDENNYLTYDVPDFGLEFLFHPLDFTQINFELNQLMLKQVIAFLELSGQDTVLDLFCGLGNFTLPIARQVGRVTGIEGDADMVSRATINAQHNQINNAEFYTADLMSLSTIKDAWSTKKYDKVLLDPPRAGAQTILPQLKQFKPQKIVYVSCNPATLARDAGYIVHQHHYQLTHVGIMNMFPHTSHIESMAVFEK